MRVNLLFLFILFVSCTGIHKAKRIAEHIATSDQSFFLKKIDSLSFTYSGCGGFYIKKGNNSVLIDPYFSNIGPMALVKFKRLKTDTVAITTFFSKVDTASINFLLTGHSHIDHVGDYPYIIKNYINSNVQLVGNKSLHYLLSALPYYRTRDSVIYDHANRWIYSTDSLLRVMPIESEHAPHFLGLKVAPEKPLKNPEDVFPNKSKDFPEGVTYNYMIDFLNQNEEVVSRIFSFATAAADYPIGMPSKELLAEHPVDVLLLCGASHQYAAGYPENVLKKLTPQLILVSHWENFFKDWKKLKQQPRVVPLTNMKKFIHKLEQSDSSALFVLPNVGTTIEVHH